MRTILLVFFFIISFFCFSQNFKKSEFKNLYNKTIISLKNNDTIGFINLWEYPDSVSNSCGDYVFNIFHIDALKRHFAEISTNWKPYIQRLKYYDVDIDKRDKEYISEWGQSFCYLTTIDNKKDNLIALCSSVIYFRGRLVYPQGALLSSINTE